jgi:cytochrome c peroxidase
VFNTKSVLISGVAGLNDAFFGGGPTLQSCGYCHDTPNVGGPSLHRPMNIGVADPTNPLGVGYLPVITLRNNNTNATVQTTDPGVALVTGKWSDIGKVKVPILRGLASRAPYFHNGSAQTLSDVLNFYEFRFGVSFTAQERADLIAFLNSL